MMNYKMFLKKFEVKVDFDWNSIGMSDHTRGFFTM